MLIHRSCFDVLHLKYNDLLEDALLHAGQVSRFLGGRMDPESMAAAVNPTLYRNRS